MRVSSYIRRALMLSRQHRAVSIGFVGLPTLVLAAILVQAAGGAGTFALRTAENQIRNQSLWTLPVLGCLVWGTSLTVGLALYGRSGERGEYLAKTLWWSGVGIEVLCLVTLLSHA